ncbi:MAG: hypothetical protein HC796_04755 [Synechococcaceae cyanobacterium RL_1_2]|nr:hypothetical protein [Synechococcaceae cyanobacterium RL_1_2]
MKIHSPFPHGFPLQMGALRDRDRHPTTDPNHGVCFLCTDAFRKNVLI